MRTEGFNFNRRGQVLSCVILNPPISLLLLTLIARLANVKQTHDGVSQSSMCPYHAYIAKLLSLRY